jgi:hypothetical protein
MKMQIAIAREHDFEHSPRVVAGHMRPRFESSMPQRSIWIVNEWAKTEVVPGWVACVRSAEPLGWSSPVKRWDEICYPALYQQKLADGDDPVAIAKRLTLAIWRSNIGGDASGGFNRPLSYPNIGVA